MSRRKTQIHLVLLMVVVMGAAEVREIPFSNEIAYPNIQIDKVSKQVQYKLVSEPYVELIPRVNFELSSKLYVSSSKVPDHDIHNTSSYMLVEENSTNCTIYPTDFSLKNSFVMSLPSWPTQVMLIQNSINNFSQNVLDSANGFVMMNNGKIISFQIQHENKGIFQLDLKNHQRIKFKNYLPINDADYRTHTMININSGMYLVSKNSFKYYNMTTGAFFTVFGFQNISNLIAGGSMSKRESSPGNEQHLFYLLTQKNIVIYKLINETNIEMVRVIEDLGFGDQSPTDGLYDNNYFYLVGFGKLVVIDLSVQDTPRLSQLSMNGTCFSIEKFQSTLHVGCSFNRAIYMAEFRALGTSLTINRFYSDIELPDTVKVKRVGESVMALVGDEEIRLIHYGINRKVLLEAPRRQPHYNIFFPKGIDLFPLLSFSEKGTISVLGVYENHLELIEIQQTPAELYCQFPKDKAGATYSVLMKFNTSRCSYVKEESTLFDGSLDAICEISIPVEIHSKSRQMEKKEGLALTGVFIGFILFTLAIISIVAVKIILKYEEKIKNTFRKLKSAKQKGYKTDEI